MIPKFTQVLPVYAVKGIKTFPVLVPRFPSCHFWVYYAQDLAPGANLGQPISSNHNKVVNNSSTVHEVNCTPLPSVMTQHPSCPYHSEERPRATLMNEVKARKASFTANRRARCTQECPVQGTHHDIKQEPGVGQDDFPVVDVLVVEHPCPRNLLVQQLGREG